MLATVYSLRVLEEVGDEVIEEVVEVHLCHVEDAIDDLIFEQVVGAVDQDLEQHRQEVDRQVLRENGLRMRKEKKILFPSIETFKKEKKPISPFGRGTTFR